MDNERFMANLELHPPSLEQRAVGERAPDERTPDERTPDARTPDVRALVKTAEIMPMAPAPMVLKLGNPEGEAQSAFSFNILWQALLQRLKVAVPLGIGLAAIVCVAVCYFTEPRYRSHSTLRII